MGKHYDQHMVLSSEATGTGDAQPQLHRKLQKCSKLLINKAFSLEKICIYFLVKYHSPQYFRGWQKVRLFDPGMLLG